MNTLLKILPMIVNGLQHLIFRVYRESGPLQYLRELPRNSEEAQATRIEIQPEWNAVERLGVYRYCQMDDGKGITKEEMYSYLNTFGGGGKPIGGAHENFGVGAKTSILPWNEFGMIVIS